MPATAEEARRELIEGNRVFAEWMRSCRAGVLPEGVLQYVVPCGGLEAALLDPEEAMPVQRPFAVVLGCSDARVPTEMLFGQGFNDLFVVRVAGNVLGDTVLGTMDFSIQALSDSVRVLVVLGHTNCGAVKGAVDAYLDPRKLWSHSNSPSLRLIFQQIFVAVRESDNAIKEVWGGEAASESTYRDALIDLAVHLNAAHTAFALRQQLQEASKWDIDVLLGVYDVRTYEVCMPTRHGSQPAPAAAANLAYAPGHPREFLGLAIELAKWLRPDQAGQ